MSLNSIVLKDAVRLDIKLVKDGRHCVSAHPNKIGGKFKTTIYAFYVICMKLSGSSY